ncbi:MAG: cyclic nucleotide-binding domain-containing protein, partial [Actinomycetota bacterium]|nr:cyclic nucleotide-binding domain-containing protein [Actinomycetota bacterium]
MAAGEFSTFAARSPYFHSVAASSRARLAAGATEVSFRRGRVLFLEGEDPGGVYLVRTGLVRLFVTELDGSETTVRIAGAG